MTIVKKATQPVSFGEVLRSLQYSKKNRIRLELRQKRFMFGALNYGDVPGMINEADGDCWDIFLPGMTRRLNVNKTYTVKRVLGAIVLENGNHKIAVELFVPGFEAENVDADVKTYMEKYTQFTRVGTSWKPCSLLFQETSPEANNNSASESSSTVVTATSGSSLDDF